MNYAAIIQMNITTRNRMRAGFKGKDANQSSAGGNSFSQVNQSDLDSSQPREEEGGGVGMDGAPIDNEASFNYGGGDQSVSDQMHITQSLLLSEQANDSNLDQSTAIIDQNNMQRLMQFKDQVMGLSKSNMNNNMEPATHNQTQNDSLLSQSLANIHLNLQTSSFRARLDDPSLSQPSLTFAQHSQIDQHQTQAFHHQSIGFSSQNQSLILQQQQQLEDESPERSTSPFQMTNPHTGAITIIPGMSKSHNTIRNQSEDDEIDISQAHQFLAAQKDPHKQKKSQKVNAPEHRQYQQQQQPDFEEDEEDEYKDDEDVHMQERNQKKRSREELDRMEQYHQQQQQKLNQQRLTFRPNQNANAWRDQNFEEDRAYARHGGLVGQSFGQNGNPTKMTVTRSQLMGIMKSKLDIFNILSKEGQFYLPPFAECTMIFIKDVMCGKKKAFRNHSIRMIDVPNFEELSAKNVFEQVRGIPKFQLYLPDLEELKRPLNRQYLFNIVNTIDEQFFIENIREGYKQRKIRHSDKNESKMEMDTDIFNLLMGSHQIVHNRGRALAYLGNAEKKRMRLDAFGVGGDDNADDMPRQARPVRPRHHYNQAVSLRTLQLGSAVAQQHFANASASGMNQAIYGGSGGGGTSSGNNASRQQ